MGTSAAEILVIAFAALPDEEQEEAFARIASVRVSRLADAEEESAFFVRSLRRVADVSNEVTPDVYRRVRLELLARGVEVAEFSAVVRHFGSWRKAKEALSLVEVDTVHKIEARFRARVRGRPRPFTDDELKTAMSTCAAAVGRVPLLSEYDAWRRRELELARTRGELPRVPSPAAFRRRYTSWEGALSACGYSSAEIYVRLEPRPGLSERVLKVDRYSEKTLRVTLERCASELGHVPLSEQFDAWRQALLRRTRARSVVLPSNSPYRRRFGTWERALLHFGFTPAEIDAQRRDGRARSTAATRSHRFRSSSG